MQRLKDNISLYKGLGKLLTAHLSLNWKLTQLSLTWQSNLLPFVLPCLVLQAKFDDETLVTLSNQLKNAVKRIENINMVNLILKTETETHVLNCLTCVQDLTCLFLQIFLPIVSSQHCYVQCFNLMNQRADYLSCTASVVHERIAKKDYEALMEEMYKVEQLAFKKTKKN